MAEGRKEYVWYPAEDKDEWRLCQLLSRTPGGGTSLRFNQKELLVPPEEVKLICPRDGSGQQNLASLEKDGLGDDRVEDAIRNQFCNQNPYSNIDEITLCVNPFRYLPIFDETFIDKYASLDANLPPHIFNATARAYQRSMAKKENQVLCLLGDRSSGKSKALEHLLCFLGQTAGDGDEEFKRVLEVLWPFLSISSSLGRHTWLSTRALLEVELGFAADGFICHTQLKVRCLEAHRVAHRGAAKNFDVLYLAAKDDDAAEWLGDSVEFQILGDEIDFEEYDESGAARQRWRAAVDAVDGMDHNELVRILCGVILLGQIQFSDSLQCEPAGTLDAASKALGVNSGALLGALLQGVFWVTAAFSIFAYLWLVLIVQVISPNVIEVWEALVTLGWLPVLILVSYLTDIGWFSGVRKQPLVEKPVSLSSDGQVPLATTTSSGTARQVWRHDLKRSRDYPDFSEDASCSQSDDSSRGSEPVVVLDRRGVPYQNVYGVITFSDDTLELSCGLEGREVSVPVFRKNGVQGTVRCKYRTEGLSAVAGYDFTAIEGELQWSPGEMRQEVTLELLPKQLSEAADQFQLVLEDPEGGAIFNPNQDGSEDRCVLTITILNENDELTRNIAAMKMSQFVDKVMNIDKLRLGAQSWYEDIISSVCDATDDGERASCLDWMHHIFSMPWKFTLSVLIPPTAYCGGWLCFVMAIGAIGVLTCAICDFAELFGCVTSLEDSITAITIVALGTSMPDLFASQTAAVTDRYADASIVNVTGSNSVNVFLGIGLPWSIAAIYWSVAGPTQKWLDSYESHLGAWPKAAFIVQGGDLAFSVAVFNVAAGLALLIIHLRRSRLQGELGGPGGMKVLSGLLLISLWLFYLTLSIWKIKSNTTDIGTQIFAIFIGFCSLENLVLLFSCALLMRFGTAFFTGRPGQQADDEEAARLVADGREVASKGDLRHVARPGLSPVAPPAFTVKEVHGRPECYGRQNKSLDISFTSAAFVCFAAKRLQRAGRKVAESFRGLPPMPPPMFPPPSTLTLSPAGPQGGIERVPSFYSIDSEEGRDRQRRPSLTGRMAGLISGHAADWAALTVAGLAAGTLADPNGPRFLG